MTAQTSIMAADLRVGDRLVWPGESKYNVAADIVESVMSARPLPADAELLQVVTRCNSTNRVRLMAANYSLRVLMPRPADEAAP